MLKTLRQYKGRMRTNRSAFRRFLGKIEKNPPRGLDTMVVQANATVWQETDCLACANCCKTMSPTYTATDIKRISAHLGMSPEAFRKKWLYKDRQGDWMNKSQPCQFLNLEDNKCSIYAVRPRDCAGFPHHTKRRMVDYMHVFKQNVEYCPATYRLVEEIMKKVTGKHLQ